jgi:hypothetical protein
MNRVAKKTNRRGNRRRQSNLTTILVIGGLTLVVIAIVVLVIQGGTAPVSASTTTGLMGTPVPATSRDHIPTDQVPANYNNPPAGGEHYDTTLPAKFYLESDVARLAPRPEGYLTHNLEHGYVIFWYDCDIPGTDCSALQQTIQQVMNATGNTKLIAFPWHKLTVPLAMSSWGQVMYFPTLDTAAMQQFVLSNRYKAPEPDAQ